MTLPLLLSQRQAAKVLGVDRNTTFRKLITDGRLTLFSGKISRHQMEEMVRTWHDNPEPPDPKRSTRTCEACGWVVPRMHGMRSIIHKHHVRPRSVGGTNAPTNLVALCPNCHAIAHHALYPKKDRDKWAITRDELIEAIRNLRERAS